MIGRVLSYYEVVDKLGEGGMFQYSLRTLCVSSWNFENPAGAQRKREVLL
jgi:hypothetical protein